jgi:hypothetical protein
VFLGSGLLFVAMLSSATPKSRSSSSWPRPGTRTRTAMRYIEPGGEAVAEITGLLGPSRRRH